MATPASSDKTIDPVNVAGFMMQSSEGVENN
jgi:hypothetical protein